MLITFFIMEYTVKQGLQPSLFSFFFFNPHYFLIEKDINRDFPGGPVVKNPRCSTGNTGSVSGWGSKIPYAAEQLSLHTATA